MTLLIEPERIRERKTIAAGPLAPLARSLRDELTPLLERGFEVPREKALLSRDGGRCERDGTLLRFDPFSPRAHTCSRCGVVYRRGRDYLAWITSYQLWLAERAVYAATLQLLDDRPEMGDLAESILDAYTAHYLEYPNRDNALGPTRLFFSTYLESIWLLQIAVAQSLLEAVGTAAALGQRVRDRILEPSTQLIASFDEGDSNRQVWNVAALLAGGRLLGDSSLIDYAVQGTSGVMAHLSRGLLRDGSWYEGENYHVFAHRGLWYGVTMAQRLGCQLPGELIRRFNEGFAVPILTALPDLTIPSRRDSQYAISLRQWRFAESFELGLARHDDARLVAALGRLYAEDVPRTDPARWRSAADTQPHEPASALGRADLGWRGLLFARADIPPARDIAQRSIVLEEQGLAIFRRDGGRVYVALDYGQSGGGHGHPDRLNVLFTRGEDRILDDYGTGSYVDPSLHWYRSSLAHNAPFFNGVSQRRAAGTLLAHEERGAAGWVDAEVPINGLAPGVRVRRSLVIMTDYFVDRLEWDSANLVRAELPLHVDGTIDGLELVPDELDGGTSEEDGFAFVRDAARASIEEDAVIHLTRRAATDIEAWLALSSAGEWWRAVGPGPPGSADRPFSLVRVNAAGGSITSVWSWEGHVTNVRVRDGILVVERGDAERHEHARTAHGWSVTLQAGHARSSIDLGGLRPVAHVSPRAHRAAVPAARERQLHPDGEPLRFSLGESSYRRSEDSWEDAGQPRANITIEASRADLNIRVEVQKPEVFFRAPEATDPALDNEHPDIHSDGVQLYINTPEWPRHAGWLLVPAEPPPRVRVRHVDGTKINVPLLATWASRPAGYDMQFTIPLDALGGGPEVRIALDLIVNDMSPSRIRRRGQLTLSGGGGWIYLQGDRQSPSRFLPIVIRRV